MFSPTARISQKKSSSIVLKKEQVRSSALGLFLLRLKILLVPLLLGLIKLL
jgi:hypothetical protein